MYLNKLEMLWVIIRPVSSHCIDDHGDWWISAIYLRYSVNSRRWHPACSNHGSYPVLNNLSPVVRVLDSSPFFCCKPLRWFSPTNPKLILLPQYMEWSWIWRQSSIRISLALLFRTRRAGWIAMRRIDLLTTPKFCCNPRSSRSIGRNVVLEELVLHVQFMSGHREKKCNPRLSRSIGRNVVLEELVLSIRLYLRPVR